LIHSTVTASWLTHSAGVAGSSTQFM